MSPLASQLVLFAIVLPTVIAVAIGYRRERQEDAWRIERDRIDRIVAEVKRREANRG